MCQDTDSDSTYPTQPYYYISSSTSTTVYPETPAFESKPRPSLRHYNERLLFAVYRQPLKPLNPQFKLNKRRLFCCCNQ